MSSITFVISCFINKRDPRSRYSCRSACSSFCSLGYSISFDAPTVSNTGLAYINPNPPPKFKLFLYLNPIKNSFHIAVELFLSYQKHRNPHSCSCALYITQSSISHSLLLSLPPAGYLRPSDMDASAATKLYRTNAQ